MPTYQYACTSCGEQVEAVQRFTDEPLKVCLACGGSLRKVYSPVGIVFKGSGFYRTDSRKSSAGTEDAGSKTAASNGSGDKSDRKKDGKDGAAAGSSNGKTDAKKSGETKASQPAGTGSQA